MLETSTGSKGRRQKAEGKRQSSRVTFRGIATLTERRTTLRFQPATVIAYGLLMLVVAGVAEAQSSGALSAFEKAKAEALFKDHLPCLGCHKLNGEGGNIAPDLTRVRQRRSASYIAAMVADPQSTVPGVGMPRILMDSATREVITRYLTEGAEGAAVARIASPRATTTPPDGAMLYTRWCAACHGFTGRGNGPNAANLPVKPAAHSSKEAMSARPDDSLYDTIAAGGAVMNRSPRMPAFGATLSTAEIRALVRHIRTLCACEGPGWSR